MKHQLFLLKYMEKLEPVHIKTASKIMAKEINAIKIIFKFVIAGKHLAKAFKGTP